MTKTTKKTQTQPRRQQQQFFTPARLGIVALVAVALVISYAVWQSLAAQNEKASPLEGLEIFPGVQQGHAEGTLTYEQTPPVGGVHDPAWQNCGVYTTAIRNGNGVHSLEHGAIWFTYRPDLPADQVAALQALTRRSSYRLLSPYPDLPAPIVASAWGAQIKVETADDPRLERFIQRYEQSPLGPEPGAACSGGVGQPS